MSWLNITKIQGAVLCLFLCVPYGLLYYEYFGQNRYTLQLLTFFLFGVLLHFFQKIEPGTRAELVFFGKARNFFWDDGYCLVPSILPILHHAGIYLLWSLKKEFFSEPYRSDRNVSIEHFQDQRRLNYNMNTQTSPLGMAVSRILEGIFGWFFGINSGDPELLFQRIGQRIMVLSIILGIGANTLYPTTKEQNDSKKFSFRSETVSTLAPREGMTIVRSRLREGMPPQMPLPENFVPMPTSRTLLYFHVDGDVDKRKYFHFHEPKLGELHTIRVTESMCAVIPAGREVVFLTKHRPQYEVNTEDAVMFIRNKEKKDTVPVQTEVASWQYIYGNWSMVDFENYGIKVRALPDDNQPESGKGIGGVVCF